MEFYLKEGIPYYKVECIYPISYPMFPKLDLEKQKENEEIYKEKPVSFITINGNNNNNYWEVSSSYWRVKKYYTIEKRDRILSYLVREKITWISVEDINDPDDVFKASSPRDVLKYLFEHLNLSQYASDWQEKRFKSGNLAIFSNTLKEKTEEVFMYEVIPIL